MMTTVVRTVFPMLMLALFAAPPSIWCQDGGSALRREIVAATFPEGPTVKLALSSTPHLAEAAGQARVKRRRGITAVEVELEGMQPAMMFGGDFNTYVLWIVSPEGYVWNAGEVITQGVKAKQSVSTPLTTFGIMISAEPHFLVDKPSSFLVLSSNDYGLLEQKETSKLAFEYADFVEGYRADKVNLAGPYEAKGISRSERHQAVVAVRFAEESGAQEWAKEVFEEARASLSATLQTFASGADEKQLILIAHTTIRKAVQAKQLAEERRAAAMLHDERTMNRETIERLQAGKTKAETDVARLTAEVAGLTDRHGKTTERLQSVEKEMLEVNQEADQLARERSAARKQAAEAQEQAAGFYARMQKALAQVAEIRESERGLVVSLPDVMFASNSTRLQASAKETLSRIAGVLLVAPEYHLSIEGHTDSTGRTALNQQLSEKRAISVVNYLGGCGFSPAMMSMRGFGETQPIASNKGANGRKKNRRVEIIIEGLTR
jgi:outer membrane protein OmpA-like peptidoglycan-associated protein